MTAVDPSSELMRLVRGTRCVLLDFDGPVCSIFAGVGSWSIANELRKLLRAPSGALPPEVETSEDPFTVLRYAATVGSSEAANIDSAFRSAELASIGSARPTPYAREVAEACRQTGKTLAVVSNNSTAAVEAFLTAHGLAETVDLVVGRNEPDPALLKPAPYLVNRAASLLGVPPSDCALVGDSVSDITAAHTAGVRSIGYANKPYKHQRLTQAGAHAVTTSMGDLATALLGREID